MKTLFLLTAFIFIWFQFSNGQQIVSDSSKKNPPDKVRFGIYITPSFSFNIGEKIVPSFHDGADCNCGYSYSDQKESGKIGYNVGFEIETKKISKKIFISTGLYLEYFNYTGTAIGTSYFFWSNPQVGEPHLINYSYKDYFINLPVLVHRLFFINNTNRFNMFIGPAMGFFLNEINSGNANINEYNWTGIGKGNGGGIAVFGITGIDYFIGKENLLNLGLRFTSQLNTTPQGRRLASLGIKTGIYF